MATDKPAPDADAVLNPDDWSPGLRFARKALNIKSVRSAASALEVLPICLSHNLRQQNHHHRHRTKIDPARTAMNEVLRGPSDLAEAIALCAGSLRDSGIEIRRRDSIIAVETVFQCPDGYDIPIFWAECLAWVDVQYQHVVSAIVTLPPKNVLHS